MIDILRNQLEELAKHKRISLEEMFPPQFMSEHTRFATIERLFEKSGFKIESAEDFKAISDDEWEKFINQDTGFTSWEEMEQTAFKASVRNTCSGYSHWCSALV